VERVDLVVIKAHLSRDLLLNAYPDQRMAAVLAGAGVGEHLARQRAETESLVEFAIGQQSVHRR
jgi:hypothetical protein